jgi:signal transduction histidine kinase/ActR/RegA family two-component response regulator
MNLIPPAHAWGPGLSVIAYAALAAALALRGPRTQLRSVVLVYVVLMGSWSATSFMAHIDAPPLSTSQWLQLTAIPAALSPWAVLRYTYVFLGRKPPRWVSLFFIGGVGGILVWLLGDVVRSATVGPSGIIYEIAPIGWLAYLSVVIGLPIAVWTLVRAYLSTKDADLRNRILYPGMGIGIVFIGTLTNLTPLGTYGSDILASLMNALLLGYGVVRYELPDVGYTLRRMAVWGVFVAAATALILGSHLAAEELVGGGHGVGPLEFTVLFAIFAALAMAIVFFLVKPLAERLIDRRAADVSETLLNLGLVINRSLELHAVEAAVRDTFARLWQASDVWLLALRDKGFSQVQGAAGEERQAPAVHLPQHSPLVTLLEKARQPLSRRDALLSPLAPAFLSEETAVLDLIGDGLLAPLINRDQMAGILLVGAKRTGLTFSRRERRVLAGASQQIASATANARLYAELLDANRSLSEAARVLRRAERTQALAQLASGVAHDFANLLTPIIGRTELALRALKDPGIKSQLEIVKRASEDAARLARRLLLFGRPQEPLEDAVASLNEIVNEAVELVQSRLGELQQREGVQITIQTDLLEEGLTVRGDPAEYREVLLNLLLNAADAMPQGGWIRVKTREDRKKGVAVLTVGDTGTGMDADVLERAFDPFFTTKGERGTGLGLALCHAIVTRFGGAISIDSTKGKGTTVTIEAPISTRAPAVSNRDYFHVDDHSTSRTILVVDDDLDALDVLAQMVAACGFQIQPATSGLQAIELLDVTRPDVVMTDLAMPDLSGFEVASQVKRRSPQTPVILVTGWNVSMGTDDLKRAGIDRVVMKPFQQDRIVAVLGEVFAPASSVGQPQRG